MRPNESRPRRALTGEGLDRGAGAEARVVFIDIGGMGQSLLGIKNPKSDLASMVQSLELLKLDKWTW